MTSRVDSISVNDSESYTCSLASTSMSPNQTCDDLPGAGRIIDTYFYQPAGRYLERQIYRLMSARKARKLTTVKRSAQFESVNEKTPVEGSILSAEQIIKVTEDVVTSFIESLANSNTGSCGHCWFQACYHRGMKLGLHNYLVLCGARNPKEIGRANV